MASLVGRSLWAVSRSSWSAASSESAYNSSGGNSTDEESDAGAGGHGHGSRSYRRKGIKRVRVVGSMLACCNGFPDFSFMRAGY